MLHTNPTLKYPDRWHQATYFKTVKVASNKFELLQRLIGGREGDTYSSLLMLFYCTLPNGDNRVLSPQGVGSGLLRESRSKPKHRSATSVNFGSLLRGSAVSVNLPNYRATGYF